MMKQRVGLIPTVNNESGNFIPVLEFGGLTTGITYLSRKGSYQRVGNLCYIVLEILLSNKGTAIGGATISGLPFAGKNFDDTTVNPIGSPLMQNANFLTLGPVSSYVLDNTKIIKLFYQSSITTSSPMQDFSFTNTTVIIQGGVYAV